MSGKQNLAWAELERRWHGIFSTLHSGGEVPPAQRLRTEGLMEAIVLLGIASPENVQDAFPQIPGFGQRAPVYPSTRD
jgi:hypothetical protein